jgi:hypothetical protein
MSYTLYLKYRTKILWIIFLLFILWPPVRADAGEDDISWIELETKHTIIKYQSEKDLKRFDKKIDYYPVSSSGLDEFLSFSSGKKDLKTKVKGKADALYRRAQDILGMRKPMKKVTINIYHNRRQLKSAFFEIYKKEGKFRAWYIYEFNTIYINVDDLHEGMLAHEMAHSIIDHYLTIRPPSASAEILARYVDSHLLE